MRSREVSVRGCRSSPSTATRRATRAARLISLACEAHGVALYGFELDESAAGQH